MVLYDSERNEIATSDDWIEQPNADVIASTGVAPAGYHDPSIMAVLKPGAYTAVVSPKLPIDEGVALIEVFEANNGKADLASSLLNISTRGEVRTNEAVMFGGFIISGDDPKKIYIRSVGPSLPLDDGKLADPRISLRDNLGAEILANDNWRDASNVAEIEATQIPPEDDFESAAVVELEPGAYTVIVDGADGGTGVAIIEIFEMRD